MSKMELNDVSDVSSTAEKLQFTRTVTQGRRWCHRTFDCILSFNLQVDILDLPAVVHHRWPDETEHLFEKTQAGLVSVDGPGNSHQNQAVRGTQGLQALFVQVGTEEEALFPGQRQETQVHKLSSLKLLRLCTDSSKTEELWLNIFEKILHRCKWEYKWTVTPQQFRQKKNTTQRRCTVARANTWFNRSDSDSANELIKASKQPAHVKRWLCTYGRGEAWRRTRSAAAPSPEAADPVTGSDCLKVGRTTGKTASQRPGGRRSPRPSHLWTLPASHHLLLGILHWLQSGKRWYFLIFF